MNNMNFTTLPLDILFITLEYLDLTDLLTLSRSSRSLRQIAALRLWRTVSIGKDSNALFDDEQFYLSSPKYRLRRHNLSISVQNDEDWGHFLQTASKDNVLTCVETLRIDCRSITNGRAWKNMFGFGWTFEKFITTLARRCTSLRVLEFTPKKPDELRLDFSELNFVLDTFQNVNDIRIRAEGEDTTAQFIMEELCSRHISALKLIFKGRGLTRNDPLELPNSLQRLIIECPYSPSWTNMDQSVLERLTEGKDKLEMLKLKDGFTINNLDWVPPSVKNLVLSSHDGFVDKPLESLSSIHITRLELALRDIRSTALVDCPNLESLWIKNLDWEHAAENNDLLCSSLQLCPRVTSFACEYLPYEVVCGILETTQWSLQTLIVHAFKNKNNSQQDIQMSHLIDLVNLHSAESLQVLAIDWLDCWMPRLFQRIRSPEVLKTFVPLVTTCTKLDKFYVTISRGRTPNDYTMYNNQPGDLSRDIFRPLDQSEVVADNVVQPRGHFQLLDRLVNTHTYIGMLLRKFDMSLVNELVKD